MKWYEANYVNHRDWILDNLDLLGLDAKETVIVLLIDFMNEHKMPVTVDTLSVKTGFTDKETEQIISALCMRKLLEIKAVKRSVRFILDGLFETDIAKSERVMDQSLFETFESVFGRTLSRKEMDRINEWNRTTQKELIIYALREASAYQALSIEYVDKVLTEWKKKGIRASDIAAGDKL